MSTPLQVTIVRAGREIGTYELAEVLRLLGTGTLKPTDLYWHEGMVDWELVSKLDNSEGLKLPAEPAVKPQTSNNLFGCGGCGLLLFLFPGIFSVFCYFNKPPQPGGGDYTEFGSSFCCPISLLGLCIFIINKKRRELLPLGEPPA